MSAPPKQGFWQEAFAWQGSITPLVLPRVAVFGAYALVVCAIIRWGEAYFRHHLEISINPLEIAGAAISLLLVLRTNAGYDRWWEARKLWGAIVNQSRNLAVDALAYGPNRTEWREKFVRLAAALPFVIKASLRAEGLAPNVPRLVGDEMAGRIGAAEHMPMFVSLELAGMLEEARRRGEIDSFAFVQIDRERALMMDHLGGCERILKTPLARVYAIKVRRFITLFLLALPFPLINKMESDWLIPLFTMMVAYPLLSLDEIGVELQNPFWEENLSHLPLIAISQTIEDNLLALLAEQGERTQSERLVLAQMTDTTNALAE